MPFSDILAHRPLRQTMVRNYDHHGLSFQFPENWKLDEETVEDGSPSVWLYPPGGGFWSVTMYGSDVDAQWATQQTLDTMRGEYPDLDVDSRVETIAGQKLAGYEMNFVCLDMVNTARVLCLEDDRGTLVILEQAEDQDWENLADVYTAVTTSLLASR